MSPQVIRHIVLSGRVQGVGFRAFVEREALKRALEGWVRNWRDGSVAALFAGPPASVAEMIEVCRRGPFSARVNSVDQRDGSAEELKLRLPGRSFSELPTA